MNNSIKMLSPFVLYCQKVIPLAFDESMSYYECLCALYSYLKDTVVPAVNNNADALEEVQKAMTELKEYVDTYFDNLDLQTEVNNKLDEMAESGELAQIIGLYLNTAFIFGFDTKAAMKAGDNYLEGSIVKTLGNTNYANGDGSFYRIRQLTVSDVVDEDNIVALTNYPSLIAEKIIDANYTTLSNTVNTGLTSLDSRLDLLENKKILFIGDSYLAMDNGNSGIIDNFKTISGETNVISSVYGGTGFDYTVDNKNFITLLNAVPNDNDVTDIIVIGGYNDQYSNQADVLTKIGQFCSTAKTKFPNAHVYIGMVGFTLESSKRYPIFQTYQTYAECNRYGATYLSGVECVMHRTSYFVGGSDLTHPNITGRQELARAIYQAWKTGYYSFNVPFVTVPFTVSGDCSSTNLNLKGMIIDNKTYIQSQGNRSLYFASHPSYSDIHNVGIEIGTLTLNQNGSIMSPWPYNMYPCKITAAVYDSTGYRTMNGIVQFINDKIELHFEDVEKSNWTDINGLREIEIDAFNLCLPTQMC